MKPNPAQTKLREIMETDLFCTELRTSLMWDDAKYQELVQLMKEVLNELDGQRQVPRWLVGVFGSTIRLIEGISKRPDLTFAQGLNLSFADLEERRRHLFLLRAWFEGGVRPPGI